MNTITAYNALAEKKEWLDQKVHFMEMVDSLLDSQRGILPMKNKQKLQETVG